MTAVVFTGAWSSSTLLNIKLKISTLSSGSSNMSITDQGTQERSAAKLASEKFLKVRWVMRVGCAAGVEVLRRRRTGNWSEKGLPSTVDLVIGTSGVVRKRSNRDAEE